MPNELYEFAKFLITNPTFVIFGGAIGLLSFNMWMLKSYDESVKV